MINPSSYIAPIPNFPNRINDKTLELLKTDEKEQGCDIFRKFTQKDIESSLIEFVTQSPSTPLSHNIQVSYSGLNGEERKINFKQKEDNQLSLNITQNLPTTLLDRHGNSFAITTETQNKISEIKKAQELPMLSESSSTLEITARQLPEEERRIMVLSILLIRIIRRRSKIGIEN
jgi:hypothetical protein